jgi:hypothetical protein
MRRPSRARRRRHVTSPRRTHVRAYSRQIRVCMYHHVRCTINAAPTPTPTHAFFSSLTVCIRLYPRRVACNTLTHHTRIPRARIRQTNPSTRTPRAPRVVERRRRASSSVVERRRGVHECTCTYCLLIPYNHNLTIRLPSRVERTPTASTTRARRSERHITPSRAHSRVHAHRARERTREHPSRARAPIARHAMRAIRGRDRDVVSAGSRGTFERERG